MPQAAIFYVMNIRFWQGKALLIALCVFALNAESQTNRTEYYFDADPGFGNGSAISYPSVSDTTFTLPVSINSLSNGLHRLFVRSQNVAGNWGLSSPRLFYKEALQTNPFVDIVAAEYFIDSDPGFNLATAIAVTPGSNTVLSFTPSISSILNGLHRIFVRTKDVNGKWSNSVPQLFYKQGVPNNPAAQIAKAEFFFDTDPGFGSATTITITPGTDITFGFSGSISSLANGLHRLYVRTQDANGKWSHCTPTLFYKQAAQTNPLVNITKAEYFLDTDPGFGNAPNIALTPGSDIVINFSGNITALTNGLHRLHVRSQDANGKWSHSAPILFYKQAAQINPLVNITKAEYFFDTDPGFGSAQDIALSPGADIVINFSGSITALTNGLHRLCVRSQDANGKWSIVNSQLFF